MSKNPSSELNGFVFTALLTARCASCIVHSSNSHVSSSAPEVIMVITVIISLLQTHHISNSLSQLSLVLCTFPISIKPSTLTEENPIICTDHHSRFIVAPHCFIGTVQVCTWIVCAFLHSRAWENTSPLNLIDGVREEIL